MAVAGVLLQVIRYSLDQIRSRLNPLESRLMATRSTRLVMSGLAAAAGALLAASTIPPASAQALRAPSSNSVAAGPTAERNSVATPNTTGLPGVTARQSTSTGTGSGSRFSVLGMPLRVAAPVTAPYNSSATSNTFAGQPANGKDAVLQQSIDGAP